MMKSILPLIVLFVVFSSHLLADDDDLKAGQEALQKGDYQAAIKSLKDAVKSNKKDIKGYILLGTAYLNADSTDLAIATLVQARELDTANVAVYMLTGDAYFKQRIYAAAVEQYKKVVELDPKNIEGYSKLGDGYRKQRKYNDAASAFMQLVALDSNYVYALHELSTIFSKAKQWANAYPHAEKLSKLRADSLNYQIELERVLYELKRHKELIPLAESILVKDGSLADVQTHLAEAYNATGQNGKVVEAYEKLNADSLSVNDLLRYAKALRALDSLARSEIMFRKAVRKDSSRCDIYYDFGTLLMKVKKYADAAKAFEHKIACDTSSGYQFASHLNLAMSLMQLQKFTEAKIHIQKAIDLRPDNVQAWVTMAQDLGQLEAMQDEIAAYKKVIELGLAANANGDEGKYNSQLGEAYRMVGVRYLIDATKDKEPKKEKYMLSLDYLKKAVMYNPKDCSLLLWTAQANQNANNKDEAKKYYHKVIDTCPKAKEAETAKSALNTLGEEIK